MPRPRLFRFPLTVLLASCHLAFAQEKTSIDPKAREVLARVTTHLRGLKSYQVDLKLEFELKKGDESVSKDSVTQRVSVRSPDRLAMVTTEKGDSLPSNDGYLLNQKATVIIPEQGRISTEGVRSASLFFVDRALGYSPEVKGNVIFDHNMGFAVFKELAFDIPNSPWEKNLTKIALAGEEKVEGKDATRLQLGLKSEQFGKEQLLEMDLWVAKGKAPLPIRLVPHVAKILGEGEDKDAPIPHVRATWTGWKFDANLPDSVFTAPPPGEKEKVFSSFQDVLDSQSDTAAYNELLETEAPDFELNLPGGKKFKLSEQKDKKVVILCFWSIEVEPSLEAIPELMKIAGSRPGVLLLTVNQGDSEEDVKKLLEEKKWDVSVAMDEDSKIGARYKADTLPLTYVIDRAGKIRGIHLGYGPDFASDIDGSFVDLAKKPDAGAEPPKPAQEN